MSEHSENLQQAAQYQQLVEKYESLNDHIQKMLDNVGGDTRKFSPEAFQQYRLVARERDEVFNEVRVLQQQWMDEDTRTLGEEAPL